MTIATKSGGLIVKDGKLAENCNCCATWNCYQSCSTLVCEPCGYSKPMPSSLNVSVNFDISSTIYLGNRGGTIAGTRWWPVRVTPADFLSASRTFQIARGTQCTYSGTNGSGFISHTVEANISSDGTLYQGITWDGTLCGTCFRRPVFIQLVLRATGTQPTSVTQPTFSTPSTGWSNAASNEYGTDSFFNSGPALAGDSLSGGATETISGVTYPVGIALFGSKATSVDVPACNSVPYDVIDYTYKMDLLYTECGGASPVVARLARAVTVRIHE